MITVFAAVALVIGLAGAGLSKLSADPPPGHPSATASPTPASPSPRRTPSSTPDALQMDKSVPQALNIPAMGVHTRLSKLGKKKGTEQVKLPTKASRPGWYDQSATPGEPGIATIVGYISKNKVGDGVFAKLAKLKRGDKIKVARQDGSTAVFRVDKIKNYPVGTFDSKEVYGTTDRPEIRMITCGGKMHKKDKRGNVVVFGHLIKAQDAAVR